MSKDGSKGCQGTNCRTWTSQGRTEGAPVRGARYNSSDQHGMLTAHIRSSGIALQHAPMRSQANGVMYHWLRQRPRPKEFLHGRISEITRRMEACYRRRLCAGREQGAVLRHRKHQTAVETCTSKRIQVLTCFTTSIAAEIIASSPSSSPRSSSPRTSNLLVMSAPPSA